MTGIRPLQLPRDFQPGSRPYATQVRAARMQVLAESIGEIKPIDPAFAREAHDYRLKPRAVGATFHYFARRVLKREPEVLE